MYDKFKKRYVFFLSQDIQICHNEFYDLDELARLCYKLNDKYLR
jgi:hypothetical protein